jgi:cation diffusion facilitator family transporter
MGGHHHHEHLQARGAESRRVALVGAVVNTILAVVKITIGITARSQALIVDGIHSLSDLLSDILVWYASSHASHGPDEQHPYGHGRFETAATLALGGMLVLVAGGIIWDSVERMFLSEELWQPKPLALYAAGFSIIANEALFWYTLLVSRRINSELLRANAWHHRTDAISSVVVLVGIAGTLMGFVYLDLVAALIVGIMVAKIGWDLGWGAMRELVDSSLDEETVGRIREIINDIGGVSSIHMLRTRRQGHEAMADVHVQVSPRISVSEGHLISMEVENRIKQGIAEMTDVVVHIDPEDDEEAPPCKGLPMRHQVLQELQEDWQHLGCLGQEQRILLHYLSGKIHVEVFYPNSCYEDAQTVETMRESMLQAVKDRCYFEDVTLYFG